MNRALIELLVRGFRGRILRMARLSRKPKYLVGTIIGVSYFGWMVARPVLRGGHAFSGSRLEFFADGLLPALHLAAALAMALYLSVSWTFFPARAPLRLRENELHILLPAPVSRRQVIQFALLKSLPGLLIGSIVVVALFSTGSLPHRLIRGAGVFALFGLWDLHGKGRNLWKLQLADLPPSRALPRRAGMMAVVALFWAITVLSLGTVVREVHRVVREATDMNETVLTDAVAAGVAATGGLLHTLLTPLMVIVSPLLGGGLYPWFIAWPALLALLAAHHLWVVNSQARFEDALLEREKQRAAEGPRRKGRSRLRLPAKRRALAPFRLSPLGRPEVAIFWKDLLVVTRWPWTRPALIIAGVWVVVLVVIATLPRLNALPTILSSFAVGTALGTPVLASTLWSNGFRRDLKHFELLRTWPVAPHRMVLGQVMAPFVQSLTTIVVAMGVMLATDVGTRLAAAWGTRAQGGLVPNDWAGMVGLPDALLPWVLAVSVLPPLAAVAGFASSLECLAALAFPGWLISFDRHRGDPAAMGNRILVVLAFTLIMVLAVLPVAIALGLVALVHHLGGWALAGWELPILGLLAAAPIVFETYLVIRGAGKLWVGLDPSEELLEGFS